MPLYDMRCPSCGGIFEKLLAVSMRDNVLDCPYCEQCVVPETMITARNVQLNITERWRPQSQAEQLTGAGVKGPGTRAEAGRASVLHVCKGGNCSLCG
ncbi:MULTISPECIES: FmdB family zinc ribbon protein [Paraburkholderia]|uniref:Zinc ribbon domain-containing protein n=1 Tax=Paraburkholderia podalyriae TaxID=1938811 RepID=A0ABR7PZW8_9BURK|nr:FmdB family zinc ribbon protein [Paraburkholderia podalyriae]MBC8751830.1 zinc ribbon domain-containing protein [Paraburkholderia podalyriae]